MIDTIELGTVVTCDACDEPHPEQFLSSTRTEPDALIDAEASGWTRDRRGHVCPFCTHPSRWTPPCPDSRTTSGGRVVSLVGGV